MRYWPTLRPHRPHRVRPRTGTVWSRGSLAKAPCKTHPAVLWKANAQANPRVRGQRLALLNPQLCGPRRGRQFTGRMSLLANLKDFHLLLLPDHRCYLRSGIIALPLGVSCIGSSNARPLCSSLHSPRNKRKCASSVC
jgi:hypothetical protein